jgi:hypothetical protein
MSGATALADVQERHVVGNRGLAHEQYHHRQSFHRSNRVRGLPMLSPAPRSMPSSSLFAPAECFSIQLLAEIVAV